MAQFVDLTLRGTAGTDVQIVPRDQGDEPPPPLLTAAVNSQGVVRIFIPRGYYVVLGGKSTLPLDLNAGPRERSVDLS